MKLIVMRHGEAETYQADDASRCLTRIGKKQAMLAGQWLSHYFNSVPLDLAIVSSYVRAEQTFQQVHRQIEVLKSEVSNDVIPDGDVRVAHDYVAALKKNDSSINSILIVSHMPFVSYFLEEVHTNRQSMLFDTSSMAVIDYDHQLGSGELEEIYHPN